MLCECVHLVEYGVGTIVLRHCCMDLTQQFHSRTLSQPLEQLLQLLCRLQSHHTREAFSPNAPIKWPANAKAMAADQLMSKCRP